MHLDRRTYCYSYSECNEVRQRRNIYLAIGICVSLCSLLIGACRYFGRKKKSEPRQTNLNPAAIRALSSTGPNSKAKPEESNEEQLPPYSGDNQGAQAGLNNPQNSSLPLYPVPPQDVNNGQSNGYFAGGFAPSNDSQPNNNQSNLPNLNNTDTIQYPSPAQGTLSQRQTDTLNNSTTTNHDQNVNTQPATDNLANNSTTPQSAQRL